MKLTFQQLALPCDFAVAFLCDFWERAYFCDFGLALVCDFELALLCDFIDIQTRNKILDGKLERLRKLGAVKSEPNITFPHHVWDESLRNHPNKEFYNYIMDGNMHGYDIGIDRTVKLQQNHRNLKTNTLEKIAITDWIIKGVEDKGNIYGPFESQQDASNHCKFIDELQLAPIGAVPKEVDVYGNILKYRPIVHMSAPRKGGSVNSAIPQVKKDVDYIRFRAICEWIFALGVGAWIWTADAQDAYLRVPVNKQSWKYMGFKWFGMLFIICSLAFGLASACRIYTEFADAVLWIILHNCGELFYFRGLLCLHHYLDDFFGGHQSKIMAERQFEAVLYWFRMLGIPTTVKKCCRPSQTPRILGFEYNTITQTVRVPDDKVMKIVREIQIILRWRKIPKRELLKIIGKLRWTSMVIFPGAAFVRHLENAAYEVKELHHFVKLRGELKKELRWWLHTLPSTKNGVQLEFILKDRKGVSGSFDLDVYTDASTSFGVGGHIEGCNEKWFRHQWEHTQDKPDIVFNELLGVCAAVRLWGHEWKGKDILIHCDNMGVVEILKRKCCNFRRKDLMELVRIIGRAAVEYGFYFKVVHIKGVDNKIADGLSRKEHVDKSDRKYVVGKGAKCKALIDELLQCWKLNRPSDDVVKRSAADINYFMHGWDNYRRLRSKSNWSSKHCQY